MSKTRRKKIPIGCKACPTDPVVTLQDLLDCCQESNSTLIEAITAMCNKQEVTNTLLTSLLESLEDQVESLVPVLYCDEDCNSTGAIALYMPEESGSTPVPVYFDANMAVTSTVPAGAPCTVNCQVPDTEFKYIEQCKLDADGNQIAQVTCIAYVNGLEESTSTIWILADGTSSMEEPAGIGPCIECAPVGSQGTILDWGVLTGA